MEPGSEQPKENRLFSLQKFKLTSQGGEVLLAEYK